MNEELIKHQIDVHDKRLNDHSGRIDKLEQGFVESRVQIQNLCNDVQGLTSVLKWLCGLIATTLVGFFIYAIQNQIF